MAYGSLESWKEAFPILFDEMKHIIEIHNLSKRYLIKHQEEQRYVALRDIISNKIKSFCLQSTALLKPTPPVKRSKQNKQDFWALKNISLNIVPGEKIGIIGNNGAGKSTLLKILSRITEPTKGRIILNGRVASLLEVGTGFHPELTGRENIFLNGAILGMSKSEIKRKFDEIVNFAEVEQFLDTPIKRYSSGMTVRLAFAVAAHLEPEILLVDEVLAVGDIQFQKKCLGKMEDVSRKEGKTVLFVSHNMAMISSFCEKCFLLEKGQIEKQGKVSDVVIHYYAGKGHSPGHLDYSKNGKPVGDGHATLLLAEIRNERGKIETEININEKFCVLFKFRVKKENTYIPNIHFFSGDGLYAFDTLCPEAKILKPGDYTANCEIPANLLNDKTYVIGVALASIGKGTILHFFEKSALSINVKDPIVGTPGRSGYGGPIPGIVRPLLSWNIEKIL